MSPAAQAALREATLPKGDAFVTAQIAGIMAAKQTANLIPLAHPLPLGSSTYASTGPKTVRCGLRRRPLRRRRPASKWKRWSRPAVAALTIYDMTKAVDKGITIEGVRLLEKSGGKSGTWRA